MAQILQVRSVHVCICIVRIQMMSVLVKGRGIESELCRQKIMPSMDCALLRAGRSTNQLTARLNGNYSP